jgi:hypothetical protein
VVAPKSYPDLGELIDRNRQVIFDQQ